MRLAVHYLNWRWSWSKLIRPGIQPLVNRADSILLHFVRPRPGRDFCIIRGFYRLPSASGIFFLLANALNYPASDNVVVTFLQPLGIFGFVITLALFSYEIYGIKKCGYYINAGKELENMLGIQYGQFASRPHEVLGFINEPFAAGIIYPAVLASWMYLTLYKSNEAIYWTIAVFFTGFVLTLIYDRSLR